jgi:serine O-acetyltransferase
MRRLSALRKTILDITKDLEEMRGQTLGPKSIVPALIFEPGFRCLVFWRFQIWVVGVGMYKCAQLISNLNFILSGAEICVGASIESPAIIRHPSGIVIGSGVSIGQKCIILQGVTIGLSSVQNSSSPDYPILGDRVVVGANSSILGKVKIADGTTVASHTLILSDTQIDTTYIGVPGQPLINKKEKF